MLVIVLRRKRQRVKSNSCATKVRAQRWAYRLRARDAESERPPLKRTMRWIALSFAAEFMLHVRCRIGQQALAALTSVSFTPTLIVGSTRSTSQTQCRITCVSSRPIRSVPLARSPPITRPTVRECSSAWSLPL